MAKNTLGDLTGRKTPLLVVDDPSGGTPLLSVEPPDDWDSDQPEQPQIFSEETCTDPDHKNRWGNHSEMKHAHDVAAELIRERGRRALIKHFPARVVSVADIHPDADESDDELLRYMVKAQQTGPVDERRVSAHFTLRQKDGSPRVGSVLLITIETED